MKTSNNCPMCRNVVKTIDGTSKLIYINNNEKTVTKRVEKPKKLTKPDTIIKIINDNRNGKFVVFSEYDECFSSIRGILRENKISYKELKGMSSTRAKYIQQFKEGKIKVLFLNSTRNGAGINLQETTDIILYHDMDSSQKDQIIGRANRIGKQDILRVHFLI